MKKILCFALAFTMVLGLSSCSTENPKTSPTPVPNQADTGPKQVKPESGAYVEEVKSMSEADLITYIQDFASSAKPIPILQDIVDSRIKDISPENMGIVREAEWVSIVYNISKYQDLVSSYSKSLIFNDDETFDYEASIKNVGDETFVGIYEGLVNNGLKLVRRNDQPYITTDVKAFISRIGNVKDGFKEYLKIVDHIDSTYFMKNSKINYAGLVDCIVYSDNYLKTYTDSEIWETVYQQFYYQLMMYSGLYGTGGFNNEDGTYNVDFKTQVESDIAANPDTLFSDVMTSLVDAVELQAPVEWNTDILQMCLDENLQKTTDSYLMEFYKKVHPDQYEEILESKNSANNQDPIIVGDENSENISETTP